METSTYTIIAGSRACVNDCPICISKMTPDYGIGKKEPVINWRKFEEATNAALVYGAKNVLITGKGEPTLFPNHIDMYLKKLYNKPFAVRELQTEGSLLAKSGKYGDYLDKWRNLGLNTIAVSIYHYEKEKNKAMFRPKSGEYFNLSELINKLDKKEYNTRLSCVLLKNYIDSIEEVKNLINFAKENHIFQLTLRRADKPKKSLDKKVESFVGNHRLSNERFNEITDFIQKEGDYCYSLSHGADVFEIYGQNVTITTGLTRNMKEKENIRQLIFFPQGWLTTSWENVQGGRLL